MFKWPEGLPSAKSPAQLADYTELICWRDNFLSSTALFKLLGRLEENDYSDGVPEEDEGIESAVGAAFDEIDRRSKACGDGYPFEIADQGYTLRSKKDDGNRKHMICKYTLYKYMLLATRLNMKTNREHACIDGTLLFEKLSAEAACEYIGDRAQSLVFGTSSGADFRGKIDNLCKRIGEGDGFVNRNDAPPTVKDDSLDIVVWKQFADRRAGKLIAFGQCKTGTSYRDTLTQLQPGSFCDEWLASPLVLKPVRMFFVADAISQSRWYGMARKAGLLFDRCRIVDFCDKVTEDVWADIAAWTEAAARATELLDIDN